MGLAVSASLFGCAHRDADVVNAQTAASAQAVGKRLAEQDRENEERHRAEIAKLMTIRVARVSEADRAMTIALDLTNRSAKDVRRVELAFIVTTPSGARIATCELHRDIALPARSQRRLEMAVPYVTFGDDAGRMREAVGTPQRYAADVKEINYRDGSDAGYDD